MKKLIIVMLAALMLLSLAACAAPEDNASDTSQDENAADTSQDEDADASQDEDAEASQDADADTSWADVEAKGSFIFGFDETFAPMGFKDDSGEYVGFDIDLAQEVASRLGLEIEFQPIDWDSKVLELNNGNIDMIWNGLTITEERQAKMFFSSPYMNNRQIIVVAADSGITAKADLAGKTVAAQIDSSAMEAIQGEPDVMDTFGELIESPDYVEALMELKQGSVDAVVIDETMGRYYISKDADPSVYTVLSDNFGEEQYGIGFRMGDQSLRDKFQETIDAMIEDGTAAQIAEKWFGDNVIVE